MKTFKELEDEIEEELEYVELDLKEAEKDSNTYWEMVGQKTAYENILEMIE